MAATNDLEKKIRFLDNKINQGERLLKMLLYLTIADVLLVIAGIVLAVFVKDVFITIGISLSLIGLVILFLLLRNLNDLKKGLAEYIQRRNGLATKP
jgi:uncharacterized Tic20 family protein